MGKLVRAIGAGVGFVAEATSKKKPEHSAPRYSDSSEEGIRSHALAGRHHPQDSDYDSSSESSADEDNWALDDAAERSPLKKSYSAGGQVSIETLIKDVLSGTRPPPYSTPELGMPVILPQRRPGSRGRGFVRAYAPVLDSYGIDQTTFLSFVRNFDAALQASPVLGVVMVGATVASFVPHGWSMLAGSLAQVVVGSAMEYQMRSRGNSYMDQINDKLFKPRGLYAVVMTYVPNAARPVSTEQMNVEELINGKRSFDSGLLGPTVQRGETYGDLELPEAAPLIFPGIDDATKAQLLKENAVKRGSRWTQDYLDRRGQARWNHENPDSDLTKAVDVKPEFNSSLADPNHPAFSGSWPTLFSGGKIPPKQKVSKDEKRARKEARKEAKYARQGYVRNPDGTEMQRKVQQKKKSKKAKSKILYLMILPIPQQQQQSMSIPPSGKR